MKIVRSGSKTPPEFVVQIKTDDDMTVLHSGQMAVTLETTEAALDVFEEKVAAEYELGKQKIEAAQQKEEMLAEHVDTLFEAVGISDKAVEKPYPVKPEPIPVEPAEGVEAATPVTP